MTPGPIASPPANSEAPIASAARSRASDAMLSEAWLTIRKRKVVILAAAVLGLAYGVYQAITQPRLYESSGEIEIRSGSSNEFRIGTSNLGTTNSSVLPTQVAIRKSDTLLLTVAHDLNLANDRDFLGLKTKPAKFVDIDADSHARNAVIDTIVALVIGIIIAFILDGLNTSLRNVAEIEAISGLPSLALIPRLRRDGAGEGTGLSTVVRSVRVLSSPKSEFAEAIRALRTSLLLSVAGREPRVILFTSATPTEGKTTVSINLACVLAERDVRVLLIDADLRRPTIHHRFGLNGKLGLTSVLTGTATLVQAVQTITELPNLDTLVSGPVPPFPMEMLGSDAMRKLLDEARARYTHVVMDSPPLLSVADSVVLARDPDAVVLLVRHGKSGKHAICRARDLLLRAGAHVSGIALNAVNLSSPKYYLPTMATTATPDTALPALLLTRRHLHFAVAPRILGPHRE